MKKLFTPFEKDPLKLKNHLQTSTYLSSELNKIGIAYIHLSTNPDIPEKTYRTIHAVFDHSIIYCHGLTAETAEKMLQNDEEDLVAFGRGFLANLDFVNRIEKNIPLNDADSNTFYASNEQGYTNYLLYKSIV